MTPPATYAATQFDTFTIFLIKESDWNWRGAEEHKVRNYETVEDAKIAAYLKKKEIIDHGEIKESD
ncbi:MAG: hypothetical protein LBJ73_02325 [Rickettsiales bacterium]|jgi:hypothetical protein|nr:hypothetical protein [Rickettsiales bacterium]